jgi:outer membrane protein assembly factor BamB
MTNPSTPTAPPFTDWVFVGSNDGKLYQLSAGSGGDCSQNACVGNCGSTIVGAPTYDVLKGMLYVGTDDGVVHGVRPPF